MGIFGNFFKSDGFIPGRTQQLENAEGIKDEIDDEMQKVFRQISRGDLGVPSHALKAAAFQYARQCGATNQQYMLCKKETFDDPRRCLDFGEKVSDCAAEFYKNVTSTCGETFLALAQCMEHDIRRSFSSCRAEQVAMDNCLYEKLGYDKAHSTVELDAKIKTDRPKPENPLQIKNYDYPMAMTPNWKRPFPSGEE